MVLYDLSRKHSSFDVLIDMRSRGSEGVFWENCLIAKSL
ncbi:hypothetical protein DESC_140035 [Desulfosarcina cetonica]|nr:hypothetical protein DESC_140035 [Desulfosarcina cetonica]